MAAPALEQLAKAGRVDCTLCGVSMKGSEVVDHDASARHQRAFASHRIDKAVTKATGWRCPGPCYSDNRLFAPSR